MDIDEINSQPYKKRIKILNWKHCSMEASRRKRPKTETDQDKLESDLMKYVRELRSKNKHVTRAIILRKALEIRPLFLGGMGTENFMYKLTQWFYYGFIQRYVFIY